MERLKERLATAETALATLDEALALPLTEISRDSSILRFTYSFEAIWKAAQLYLAHVERIETGSPAGVIRGCWKAGLLDARETEELLKMATDRNLTVHTYNQRLAEELYGRLAGHAGLMRRWVERVNAAFSHE
jgi:nucleotidyltransferase substrate binding protein (TIGR01987 family)